MEANHAAYLETLDQRMAQNGFSGFDRAPAGVELDRLCYRMKFEATKFGNVEIYVAVKSIPVESLTVNFLKWYSSCIFTFASVTMKGTPGLLAMNITYPVIVCDAVSDEVRQFVTTRYYNKLWGDKHFSATEFPVIVEISAKGIVYYTKTPLWGAAYYGGFRKQAAQFFQP